MSEHTRMHTYRVEEIAPADLLHDEVEAVLVLVQSLESNDARMAKQLQNYVYENKALHS